MTLSARTSRDPRCSPRLAPASTAERWRQPLQPPRSGSSPSRRSPFSSYGRRPFPSSSVGQVGLPCSGRAHGPMHPIAGSISAHACAAGAAKPTRPNELVASDRTSTTILFFTWLPLWRFSAERPQRTASHLHPFVHVPEHTRPLIRRKGRHHAPQRRDRTLFSSTRSAGKPSSRRTSSPGDRRRPRSKPQQPPGVPDP